VTKKKNHFQDPHYQREKERYDNPIPSREAVLSILEEEGKPLSERQLFKRLCLTKTDEQERMGYRLRAMLRDGQLMQDRRGRICLLNRINLIRGTVSAHPDGFGFLIPDDKSEDYFLSARQMMRVMHNDVVLAFDKGRNTRGKRIADIHEVVEHANASIVGQLFEEGGIYFVEPESKFLNQAISIPKPDLNGAKAGQVVLLEMVFFPSKHQQAIGKVIEVLGDHRDPGMEIEIAIHSYGLPNEWSKEVMAEVQKLPSKVIEDDFKGRSDLRELEFVTIDGEDAKDFDDAVFCKAKPKGGYQLYVAIADVSHYVRPGSALDKEAIARSTSVYFPGFVVPMLPEQLSNGICSLKPNVDRLAFVCEMSINAKGSVTRSRFYKAVIHSKARLTYTNVAKMIELGFSEEFSFLAPLYDLYKLLGALRLQRGAIEFDVPETQIEFNLDKKISALKPLVRNDAHKLIEECMLLANVSAAKHLIKLKDPALFRVHDSPRDKKLESLREFLGPMSLSLGGGDKPTPKDFAELAQSIANRPDKSIIEVMMLRSLMQAEYTEKNKGHFGLAYKAYTHFTSPIRRYPDLLTHRIIEHHLNHSDPNKALYSASEMHQFGIHCSTNERRAEEASRDVVSWLKCEYMEDKVGQSFTGRIVSVVHFGVFVALDDIYVEGLVHMTSLPPDYYHFEKAHQALIGTRTGKRFHLGDRLQVVVAGVSLADRKIDFTLEAS
jgi:ribonuclease R